MSITLQNHTVQRVWSKSKSNLKYALSYLLCEWALCYTCTPLMKPRKNFAIKLQKLPCHNNIMKDRKVLSYGRTFSTAWLIVIGKHLLYCWILSMFIVSLHCLCNGWRNWQDYAKTKTIGQCVEDILKSCRRTGLRCLFDGLSCSKLLSLNIINHYKIFAWARSQHLVSYRINDATLWIAEGVPMGRLANKITAESCK